MALTSYAELQVAVSQFLARDDLATNIPDFISLAEAKMARELDTRSQVNRVVAQTVPGSEYLELPTDLRAIQTIKLNGPVKILEFLSPYNYYSNYTSDAQGTPAVYSIVGTGIGLRPIPDAAIQIEMIYSDDLNKLSVANSSNTILARHPDAYLFGALAAASVFLMDDQRAVQFDAVFSRTIEEIRRDTDAAKYGGSLTMRSDYQI